MAYGFRFIPAQRAPVEPDPDRCPHCHARLDTGPRLHFCKEVTYGTALPASPVIPWESQP